jgi:membrane protease YdiL (CAAX protease family)
MSGFPVIEFLVLVGMAFLGSIAILPYSLKLTGNALAQAKLPRPVLLLLSVLQTTVLMAIAVAVGLLASHAIGVGAPYIETALAGKPEWGGLVKLLPISLGLGLASFVLMALCERFWFAPHVPQALRNSDADAPVWMRFLASFYGGIDEEILTRLFMVAGLAWIVGLVWRNVNGLPTSGAFWIAIILAAVLFGLGHLPATRAITRLTPMLILRAVVLNGIAGIAFGWLFWQYGLEAAMIGHFFADILLHVIGPVFIGRIYGAEVKTPRITEGE